MPGDVMVSLSAREEAKVATLLGLLALLFVSGGALYLFRNNYRLHDFSVMWSGMWMVIGGIVLISIAIWMAISHWAAILVLIITAGIVYLLFQQWNEWRQEH